MSKFFTKAASVDPPLSDAQDTDIVIPVIGDTGAGKSYFINKVLTFAGRKELAAVGSTLVSCTTQIQPIVIEGKAGGHRHLRGRRIVLVDCPGFDTEVDPAADIMILKRLANWLKGSYPKGTVLGGIIYLHDISQTRSRPEGFQKKLQKLNQLYDDKVPFSAVVFVTSKWGLEEERTCERREEELKSVHWKDILEPVRAGDKGARVMRLKATSSGTADTKPEEESAWAIIFSILTEVEGRAVDGLMSEVCRIEKRSMNPQDAQAAAELRLALEEMRNTEMQMSVLKESAGEGDVDAKQKLGEAEQDVRRLSQRIQKLAYSLLDQLSRLSRWIFGS